MKPICEGGSLAGVLDTTRMKTGVRNLGRPASRSGSHLTNGVRPKPVQESEGLVVLTKLVKASGGKGPWFRVRQWESMARRLT